MDKTEKEDEKEIKEKCKKGERRNIKTGLCEKMSDEKIKHKQSLRNKKKGVITDIEGNIIRPSRYKKQTIFLEPKNNFIEEPNDDFIEEPNDDFIEEPNDDFIEEPKNNLIEEYKDDLIEEYKDDLIEEYKDDFIEVITNKKKERCKNGERRNVKTAKCEKKKIKI